MSKTLDVASDSYDTTWNDQVSKELTRKKLRFTGDEHKVLKTYAELNGEVFIPFSTSKAIVSVLRSPRGPNSRTK